MNEDELQQYLGAAIDIFEPNAVKEAVEYIHCNTGIEKILIHMAAWALVYGEGAGTIKTSLEGGVIMASTRFRIGDDFTMDDYEQTKAIPDKADSVTFCEKMKKILRNKVYCVPCKELSYVKNPTVVGLGDAFAGGLLPGLLKENRGWQTSSTEENNNV